MCCENTRDDLYHMIKDLHRHMIQKRIFITFLPVDFGGLLICYTRRSAMLYGRTKNSVAICFGLSHFLGKLTGLLVHNLLCA